ncbi:MAG: Hsp20/alpha crystallin family protein [Bacteroidota bacterium]
MCRTYSDSYWRQSNAKYASREQMHRRKWARKMRHARGWNQAPVNVQELDDRYELFVYAPGLAKEDFQISLADRLLTISVQKEAEQGTEQANWKRQEFWQRDFERRFELNQHIDTQAIKAQYTNGVLQLSLPKLEEHHTQRQDILVD